MAVTGSHAVILAAGCGRRLAAVSGGTPKCLLPFDGVSLLARQLGMLSAAGIQRVTLVTGYRAAEIDQAARAAAAGVELDTLYNPEYEQGSVLSCLTAAPALAFGDIVLLMDADVLCDARLIDRLVSGPHTNAALVDRDLPPGNEPVKFAARDGRPVGFGKQLEAGASNDLIGESVGFFRLMPAMAAELAQRCHDYQRAGQSDAPYEHPLRDLMLARSRDFGYADITCLPWIEIDSPEDLEYARSRVLPCLDAAPVAS